MGALIYITDSKIIGGDTPPRLSLETLNWLISTLDEGENLYIGLSMSAPANQSIADNQIAK